MVSIRFYPWPTSIVHIDLIIVKSTAKLGYLWKFTTAQETWACSQERVQRRARGQCPPLPPPFTIFIYTFRGGVNNLISVCMYNVYPFECLNGQNVDFLCSLTTVFSLYIFKILAKTGCLKKGCVTFLLISPLITYI